MSRSRRVMSDRWPSSVEEPWHGARDVSDQPFAVFELLAVGQFHKSGGHLSHRASADQ
jgi:hypothetical protein